MPSPLCMGLRRRHAQTDHAERLSLELRRIRGWRFRSKQFDGSTSENDHLAYAGAVSRERNSLVNSREGEPPRDELVELQPSVPV
jgi:hypothetical protein